MSGLTEVDCDRHAATCFYGVGIKWISSNTAELYISLGVSFQNKLRRTGFARVFEFFFSLHRQTFTSVSLDYKPLTGPLRRKHDLALRPCEIFVYMSPDGRVICLLVLLCRMCIIDEEVWSVRHSAGHLLLLEMTQQLQFSTSMRGGSEYQPRP